MTKTSGTNNQQKQHLIRTYSKEWYEKMIEIWRDRLDVMGIRDTGALRSSVQKGMFNIEDSGGQMTFLYLTYDIYVDLGVGNGYRRGNGEADLSSLAGSQPAARSAAKAGTGYKKAAKNGGGLYFLDPVYRHEHHKGKPRSRRPWFNVSWFISTQVLMEKLGELIGEEFSGLFDNLTNRERG